MFYSIKVTIYLFIFLFGACWGSFLNCLIYRWEQGKKINQGRSFCPKCRHCLGFWDLVPIFSFIFLRRKCRYCHEKISFQYLLVEIATAVLFLLIYILPPYDLGFKIYEWVIISFFILIFVYDLKNYIIPDKAVYPAIVVVSLFIILNSYIINHKSIINPIVAGISAGGFFFLIWLVSRGKWLGFGDVKLAFFMGLFLGFPNIILALFLAFLIGAAVGVILLALGKKKMQSQVPFGPFLVLGTFIGLFWGEKIIHWYLNLLF